MPRESPSPATLLLVDDHAVFRLGLKSLLEEEGFELLSTSLNGFKRSSSTDKIEECERKLADYALRKLQQRRYLPGFFTVLAVKR